MDREHTLHARDIQIYINKACFICCCLFEIAIVLWLQKPLVPALLSLPPEVIKMLICKVVKPLVSTNRIPDFEHKHLQVVLDGSTQKVAVDAVGCIPGDWVICVGSSAAREAAGSKSYPSDLTIVGIIDHWEPEPPKPAAPAVVN